MHTCHFLQCFRLGLSNYFPQRERERERERKKKKEIKNAHGYTASSVAAYLRLEPRLGPGTELMPELGAAIWSDSPLPRFSGFVCSYRVCSCAATLKMIPFLFFFFPFLRFAGVAV